MTGDFVEFSTSLDDLNFSDKNEDVRQKILRRLKKSGFEEILESSESPEEVYYDLYALTHGKSPEEAKVNCYTEKIAVVDEKGLLELEEGEKKIKKGADRVVVECPIAQKEIVIDVCPYCSKFCDCHESLQFDFEKKEIIEKVPVKVIVYRNGRRNVYNSLKESPVYHRTEWGNEYIRYADVIEDESGTKWVFLRNHKIDPCL